MNVIYYYLNMSTYIFKIVLFLRKFKIIKINEDISFWINLLSKTEFNISYFLFKYSYFIQIVFILFFFIMIFICLL